MPNMIKDLVELVKTSKSEPCEWCDQPGDLHNCRECDKAILDKTCHKYEGLCPECFEKWGI